MNFALLMFLFAAIIISAPLSRFGRLLRLRPLVFLGTISYSLYLVHYPLQLLIHVIEVNTHVAVPYESPVFMLLFLAMVVAVADLTYRFIELPGKHWLRSLYSRAKVRAAANFEGG